MPTGKNVVLVAGAHGISGRAAALHWNQVPNTVVYGLSRRSVPLPPGSEPITVDLLNSSDVREKLSSVEGVTHVVFGAYIEKATAAERSDVNVAILKNLVEVVEEFSSASFRHITFFGSGKT